MQNCALVTEYIKPDVMQRGAGLVLCHAHVYARVTELSSAHAQRVIGQHVIVWHAIGCR